MSLESQNGDGYGLLTASRVTVWRPPSEGGLFFVHMDLRSEGWDTVVGALRGLPPSVAGDASLMVFRSPLLRWGREPEPIVGAGPGWSENIDSLATALSLAVDSHRFPRVEVGAFELPLTAAPIASSNVDDITLARCRAVELRSFLEKGNAIWRPREYHYRLPSGHHAASFVRIADAFRDHRSPAALATWLRAHVSADTVLVIDSGTLMPIVQQLDITMTRAFLAGRTPRNGLADILALDAYPRTRFEYLRRFESLAEMDILALLSVSSTGRTYTMLRDTLQETVDSGRWRAECLVTRTGPAATSLPSPEARERQTPWYSLGDEARDWRSASRCELCRNPGTARLVQVDPVDFAAMVLPDPMRIMPHTATGRRNASLWNYYQRTRQFTGQPMGIQLAAPEWTTQRSPHLRPSPPQPIQFEETLLLGPSIRAMALRFARRLKVLRDPDDKSPAGIHTSKTLELLRRGAPTIAVCDTLDLNVLAMTCRSQDQARRRIYAAARIVCPTICSLIDVDQLSSDDLEGHTSPLLVVAGLRTGVTLQRLLVSVQDHYLERDDEPVMHGLVLHAHPPDSQAWHSLQNSFRGRDRDTRLLALWLTYVSEQSPLAQEFDLLNRAKSDWFAKANVRDLWERRREWLRPEASVEQAQMESPFWSPTKVELRRTSLYGSLDDRHTLMAVGTAMHAALEHNTSDSTPEWVQFDLPKALRSYFDGLIHAAIIRWVTPERSWWGHDDNDCVALLSELEGRFEKDWRLLLPEFLLAAALGKIPDSGVWHLIDKANTQLLRNASQRWPQDVLDYVELGLILVKKLVAFTAEEERT